MNSKSHFVKLPGDAFRAGSILAKIIRPVYRFLLKPSVRYKYLPKLRALTAYVDKEEMLDTCFQYLDVTGVKGDYLEFGLWKGANLVRAYHLSRRYSGLSMMHFHGFDSFMGIPELTKNISEADQFPAGAFHGSLEEVQQTLTTGKVDQNRVSLTKGWFCDTLIPNTRKSLNLRTVAIAYIDCDVYESTVPALDFIEPCLADGSVLIFDDWYCFKNDKTLGQQKAFAEWVERNSHWRASPYKEFGCNGKAFIVNSVP